MLIYIEFNENFLFLSKLKKIKEKFFSLKSKYIPLKNFEINDGKIFNPSSLFLKIKNFLKENKLKKPKAIICIPSIITKKDLLIKLITLQFALCTSKSGLKIEKIISDQLLKRDEKMSLKNFFTKNELNNKLDFFKQFKANQNKHPKNWFLLSIIGIICLFAILFKITSHKNSQLILLKNKNKILKKKENMLENKIKTMQHIVTQNNTLKIKLEKIKKLKNSFRNPNNILLPITQTLPKSCWLQRINISSKKPKILEIEGFSNKEQNITEFIKDLSKTPQLHSLRLEKLKRTKKNTKSASYSFKLSGKIM